MRLWSLHAVALALFLAAPAAVTSPAVRATVWGEEPAPLPRYTADPKAGELRLFVKKKGALKAFAHDHEMDVTDYAATVAWDAAAPERGSVELVVKTKGIVVLDPALSQSDRDKIAKTMKSDEVLDVERFPEITFRSRSVVAHTKDGEGKLPLSVTGPLTVHGVAKDATLDVVLSEKDGAVTVTGEHSFRQSDHGMEPYSTGLGTIGVQDAVSLRFKIVAKHAEKPAEKGASPAPESPPR